MKKYKILFALLCSLSVAFAQNKTSNETPQSCLSDEDADKLPGKYYDHTQPKYPMSLKAPSAAERTAMLNQLNAIEKVEEKSRANLTVNDCVLRTSYNARGTSYFGDNSRTAYGYQLE